MAKTRRILIGILLISAFLIFFRLGSRPIYGDEPWTMDRAGQTPSVILSTYYGSILYPLLVHAVLPHGNAAWMARLPAAVFGLLSVLAVFALGSVIFGRSVALLAALLAAISTQVIYFSQQARSYTGLLLFSILSLYFLLRAHKENRLRLWIAYALATIVGSYLHFFLLITLPVQALFVAAAWLRDRLGRNRRRPAPAAGRTAVSFLLAALAIAVVVAALYWPTRNIRQGQNMFAMASQAWTGILSGKTNVRLLSFAGETFLRELDFASSPALFILEGLLFVVGLAAAWKTKRQELGIILLYLTVPFVLFVLSNPPGDFLSMEDNKFIFTLPLILLLVARGLIALASGLRGPRPAPEGGARLRPVPLAIFGAVALAFLGGEVRSLAAHFDHLSLFGVRAGEASAYLDNHVRDSSLLITDGHADKIGFLEVSPVLYEGRTIKRARIVEAGAEGLGDPGDRGREVWGIFRRSAFSEDDLSALQALDAGIEIRRFRRTVLVHVAGGGATLAEKLLLVEGRVPNRSTAEDREAERRLYRAKVALLSGRIREAGEDLVPAAGRIGPSSSRSGLRHALAALVGEGAQRSALAMLGEQIAPLLVRNAYQSQEEGRDELALELLASAEAIPFKDPNVRFWVHFTRGTAMSHLARMDDALHEFLKAFPLCYTDPQVSDTLRAIRDSWGRPAGVMVVHEKGTVRVRWWSDAPRSFSGRIATKTPFGKIEGVNTSPADTYRRDSDKVFFQSRIESGGMKGWDLILNDGPTLDFDFEIDGSKWPRADILYAVNGNLVR